MPTRKKSVFRKIFGASPDGMILIDSTGLCLAANSAAVRILFPQPTNVRGLWVQDLLPPMHTTPKNLSFVKLLSESGKTKDHFQLLNAGKIREVDIHYRFNVSPGKHLIFLKDTSASASSEALIRKQARLLDLADDTIMVRDLNDIIVYWNQGAERLYGWRREEAVGQYVHSFLQTVFPEDFEVLRERFLHLGTWSGILIHTVKNGSQIIVHSRWTLEKDDMGKPAAYLEINNNITEKKRAEEALQGAYDELEARVSDRTAELSEANLLLQKEIQEHKDTEEALRNSEIELRALSSRLWNAQEEERRKISRELHDDLGQILTAIELDLQRALKSGEAVKRNALLQQLLQKSSEARGRIKEISSLLRPGILDDLGIREAIEHNVSEFISRTGIQVDLSLRCNSSDIRGEAATTLYRILQEALNNVSRYSNASRVSISLSPKAKRIHLSIRDNGVGFDPSSLRMEKALGLSGMRERALLLGGKFQFESSPGAGTEIRVSLPAVWGQK